MLPAIESIDVRSIVDGTLYENTPSSESPLFHLHRGIHREIQDFLAGRHARSDAQNTPNVRELENLQHILRERIGKKFYDFEFRGARRIITNIQLRIKHERPPSVAKNQFNVLVTLEVKDNPAAPIRWSMDFPE
jgi:hypothetical protein